MPTPHQNKPAEPAPLATVGTKTQTTRRSERSRPASPGGEDFDFTTISDGEEEDGQPPTQTTIPKNNTGINDPNIIPSAKNKASDVHYFFNKLLDKYQCKFCK
jgi:hypothetical protein